MARLAPEIFRGKHIAVFGAGYVGGAVTRKLLQLGARVSVLTRNTETATQLAQTGARSVIAVLNTDTWHGDFSDGADYVLNCVSSGGGGLDGYRRSYVEGLESLFRWAEAARVGPLVYTGSTSVYPQDGGVRVDESACADGLTGAPAILREAEKLALGWPSGGSVLRLAGIYGPRRHHLLDQLREGATELAGKGDHRLNLIHRDDIVTGVLATWQSGQAGEVYNLADDGALTKAELVDWLCARLGRPVPFFNGSAVPGRRAVVPDRVIANTKAKRELGWTPQYPTFREGYSAILGA